MKLSVLLFTGERYSFVDFLLSHLLIIGLFYTNAFYVIPFYERRKFFQFILITCIELGLYGAFRFLIKFILVLSIAGVERVTNFRGFTAEVFYLFFQFYIISIAYRYSINRERRIRSIEKEKAIQQDLTIELQKDYLQTELAYLKAQINPHFLYNTLSFLYSKAVNISTVLAESIMTLSDIMRYALSNDVDSRGTVLVEDEIIQVRNLIKIYKLRFNDTFFIEFDVSGELEGRRIIPLIIITIVENAFKYGEFKEADAPMQIKITFGDDFMILTSFNRKKVINKNFAGKGEVGLKNLIKRLHTHYGSRHTYEVIETKETYITNITISL
ncbi:sensor histidine kinase [Pedobacter lusitanus]|uniref:sensor histidine kinase n=1 Tax=Pedobacter lusitanus TaxID=1503925 RepID=UPI0032AFD1F8